MATAAALQRVAHFAVQSTGQDADRADAASVRTANAHLDRIRATARQRRHRERLRAGKIVVPVEIDEASLGLLITLGYLHPHKAAQVKEITKALETMLRSIERRHA